MGLDLEGKRRNDRSLRQEGLFLSQFIPLSLHACLFKLNDLFELYDLGQAVIIIFMFVFVLCKDLYCLIYRLIKFLFFLLVFLWSLFHF